MRIFLLALLLSSAHATQALVNTIASKMGLAAPTLTSGDWAASASCAGFRVFSNAGAVTFMQVSNCGVSTFPEEICSLQYLSFIMFNGNAIASLPACISKLLAMTYMFCARLPPFSLTLSGTSATIR